MPEETVAPTTTRPEGSVVDQILAAFVATVEAEHGMTQIGARLRDAILENRMDSEAELRAALFGEDSE